MSEHITHQANVKRLERSSTDRRIAGVSGGLGRYFDLNPSVFRLGFIVLTLLGGAGILVYLAAVLVIPDERSEQSIAAEVLSERRDHPMPVIGLGLAGVALIVLLSRGDLWPGRGAGWAFLLIGGTIMLWASRGKSRARRILIGLTATLSVIVIAIVAAISVAFAWFNVSIGDGVGNRTYQPSTLAEVHHNYAVGVGKLNLDLSQISFTGPATHITAHVGIGNLRIVVPGNVHVDVDAHAKAGTVRVFGQTDDGRNASVAAHQGEQLVIDATIGAGKISVDRTR